MSTTVFDDKARKALYDVVKAEDIVRSAALELKELGLSISNAGLITAADNLLTSLSSLVTNREGAQTAVAAIP